MTDNVLKNKMAKSSKPTSVDYSVVNSLEKWELNNLKNTLALLYIYEHKYLHGKKKSRFPKMRFPSSWMTKIFYELVSLVYLPNIFLQRFSQRLTKINFERTMKDQWQIWYYSEHFSQGSGKTNQVIFLKRFILSPHYALLLWQSDSNAGLHTHPSSPQIANLETILVTVQYGMWLGFYE